MKKLIILSLLALTVASCGNREQRKQARIADKLSRQFAAATDIHNSRNSLDWAGTYHGTVPCADCPGIKMTIKLGSEGHFVRTMRYIDRGDEEFEQRGTFEWNEGGNTITLISAAGEMLGMYRVGENHLTMLDLDGNLITGDLAEHYILTKE